jgi:transposase
MAKAKSWEVTDDFWRRAEALLPTRQRSDDKSYVRKSGGGRKPKEPRLVFEAILYVLSAIHARFLDWEKAGVFEALWKAGLAEYDDLEGIAWRWQSIDGAMMKAPLAQEAVGPNPTDRGKKWKQAPSIGRRTWRPVVIHRDRSQSA